MWRRVYLLLVLVRLYFALSPSYIHPDEHFQGPEIIAGEVFGYPSFKTWEFTADHPVRSIFPLWVVYGAPLTVLKWVWEGLHYGPVPPAIAFYGLRILMFLLSFVLGDWAIHELISTTRERRIATILISSSYVTWTYQTHTFSNSIETLAVLWTIVLANRLREDATSSRYWARSCFALAFVLVLGVFNRITFPAWVLLPAMQLIPALVRKPLRIPLIVLPAAFFTLLAIAADTEYYTHQPLRLRQLLLLLGDVLSSKHQLNFAHGTIPTVTPLNNLLYNVSTDNLSVHGLHPWYQHLALNLPQLIGPALLLLFFSCNTSSARFWSAVIGIATLSSFPHQEPRFLIPAVPLLLACVRIPRHFPRVWMAAWIAFNVLAGVLFGTYHQGGVEAAQTYLASYAERTLGDKVLINSSTTPDVTLNVAWWKTYSPPRWLLGEYNAVVNTTDLMGMPGSQMLSHLRTNALCASHAKGWRESLGLKSPPAEALLVAPLSAAVLDTYVSESKGQEQGATDIVLTPIWHYRRHIGLDDLDFGDDGVLPTLHRVLGRRGLGVWRVERRC